MDDIIMERIVKDLEEADETGDKFASALLEVLALIMRWRSEVPRGTFVLTDGEGAILPKLTAADQVLSAIEKGMS